MIVIALAMTIFYSDNCVGTKVLLREFIQSAFTSFVDHYHDSYFMCREPGIRGVLGEDARQLMPRVSLAVDGSSCCNHCACTSFNDSYE